MVANDAPTYANNTAIVEAVSRGEVPMGLVNHYYLERAQAEDPDIPAANHFFAEGDIGSLLITTATAVHGTSDQTEDAKAPVSFLLSAAATRYFSEDTFDYTPARGVAPGESGA